MQLGTGKPSLKAAFKMQGLKGGTVVLGSTGGRAKLLPVDALCLHDFAGLCLFLCFCLGNVFGLQTWSNGNLSSDTK